MKCRQILYSVVCFIGFSLQVSAHDIQMAKFEFNLNGAIPILTIIIDLSDLHMAVADKKNVESSAITELEEAHKPEIGNYFESNLKLQINGQKIGLNLKEIIPDGDHYRIQCLLEGISQDDPISTITLLNTCLVGEIENHSNVIGFLVGEGRRDFHMNKKRTSISVQY